MKPEIVVFDLQNYFATQHLWSISKCFTTVGGKIELFSGNPSPSRSHQPHSQKAFLILPSGYWKQKPGISQFLAIEISQFFR